MLILIRYAMWHDVIGGWDVDNTSPRVSSEDTYRGLQRTTPDSTHWNTLFPCQQSHRCHASMFIQIKSILIHNMRELVVSYVFVRKCNIRMRNKIIVPNWINIRLSGDINYLQRYCFLFHFGLYSHNTSTFTIINCILHNFGKEFQKKLIRR